MLGCPCLPAFYLHIGGRVGRSSTSGSDDVSVDQSWHGRVPSVELCYQHTSLYSLRTIKMVMTPKKRFSWVEVLKRNSELIHAPLVKVVVNPLVVAIMDKQHR